MRFFDLHCDTIYIRKPLRAKGNAHVFLEAGSGLSPWCQTFAVYVPDEIRGEAAKIYYEDSVAWFRQELLENSDRITLCATGAELKETTETGRCAAILAVENASALGGDITYLDKMFNDGVQMITITWNGVNELGCGNVSGEKAGLTTFGKDVLLKMKRLGMAADVSHLNHAGFWDVIESGVPVVASHSNADAVWQHPRSLNDEQIKALIAREGLMGLTFVKMFLGDGEDTGRQAFLRHLTHVLELGGENMLAIGSDFDGATMHPELDGIQYVQSLYQFLADQNIDKHVLDKLFYLNAFNFFTERK